MSVRDLQAYFGFEEPRAIYKWQKGETLPSVDNLYALGRLLQVAIEDILVPVQPRTNKNKKSERQDLSCRSGFLRAFCGRSGRGGSAGALRSIRLRPGSVQPSVRFGARCA